MHVVVNKTSDSEFPFIALLDIVWRRLLRGKWFTSPGKKRPEEPGKGKIKHTEISLSVVPTLVFASKGIFNPTPIQLLHNLGNGWRKSKMESFFPRMLLSVYQLAGRHIKWYYTCFSHFRTHLFSRCCLYLQRNCCNDRKLCLCSAPWPHENA